MAFCFMIGIAGGVHSDKSSLAKALCNAYSHRSVISLDMETYRKPEEELPLLILPNGDQCRDRYSPDSFDLSRMRDDIADIMYNRRCRILVVEGSLILWDKRIEELCDMRVYKDEEADIGTRDGDGYGLESINDIRDLICDRHSRYIAPSRNEADILIPIEDSAEEGVLKIRKALWGLLL